MCMHYAVRVCIVSKYEIVCGEVETSVYFEVRITISNYILLCDYWLRKKRKETARLANDSN
jgi:hypothetical protein